MNETKKDSKAQRKILLKQQLMSIFTGYFKECTKDIQQIFIIASQLAKQGTILLPLCISPILLIMLLSSISLITLLVPVRLVLTLTNESEIDKKPLSDRVGDALGWKLIPVSLASIILLPLSSPATLATFIMLPPIFAIGCVKLAWQSANLPQESKEASKLERAAAAKNVISPRSEVPSASTAASHMKIWSKNFAKQGHNPTSGDKGVKLES